MGTGKKQQKTNDKHAFASCYFPLFIPQCEFIVLLNVRNYHTFFNITNKVSLRTTEFQEAD